jgi:hypothetical protein
VESLYEYVTYHVLHPQCRINTLNPITLSMNTEVYSSWLHYCKVLNLSHSTYLNRFFQGTENFYPK